MQPILAAEYIVQVSPANTNPAWTLRANTATAPARPFKNYFRVATTDLEQGPSGARYLIGKAGKKNIAVIDDGKTYGAGLADQAAMEIIVDDAFGRFGGKDGDLATGVGAPEAGLPAAKAFTDG